ncbi:MAG: DUF3126 family protein [Pseudomonadota bacterium]
MGADEIKQIEAYLKKTLNPSINVKARPRAEDSVEVYLGEEFIAVCYKDEDEGELAYQLNMTILSEDLADA